MWSSPQNQSHGETHPSPLFSGIYILNKIVENLAVFAMSFRASLYLDKEGSSFECLYSCLADARIQSLIPNLPPSRSSNRRNDAPDEKKVQDSEEDLNHSYTRDRNGYDNEI